MKELSFDVLYEKAWEKRRLSTKEFTKEFLKKVEDTSINKNISLGDKLEKINKICREYEIRCQPAIEEWNKDLGVD